MPRTRNARAENYPKILYIVQTAARQRVRAVRAAVVDGVQFAAVAEDQDLGLKADGFLRFGGGEGVGC